MSIATLPSPASRHEVQFFRDDQFLCAEVAKFIGEGLERGEAAIIIATAPHCLVLESRLRSRGIEVPEAMGSGLLTIVDAAATLALFMVDGMPDPRRFDSSVATMVTAALSKFPRLRAYGEMVDLLSADRNHAATLALETLWNKILEGRPAHLLCGYRLATFDRDEHREPFRHVCSAHSHIVPTEDFTLLGIEAKPLAIAQLEQKANALEAEVRHRERVEGVLRRTQRDLHDFFENSPIGFHWVDTSGVIIRANNAELKLIGCTADEYVGRNIAEFHADKDNINALLKRLLGGEEVRDHRARLLCRDGTIKHVVIDSNVLWEDGQFIHTRCSTRDITEQLKAEETVLQQAAELARSNADLELFAATASHDLQEPLRMISSYLTLLERRYAAKLDEPAQRYVKQATHASMRMQDMVKALLTYAQVGQGKLSVEPVRMLTALREAMENLDDKIRSCRANISFDDLPIVSGSRPLLVQLFQNLLGNAMKFCVGRDPTIRVEAKDSGSEWTFMVSDNGIGIEAVPQTRLFKAFHRLHAADAFPGTGLGLATCKKIVELHGGRIWVESTIGVGSIFFFTLPKR
jgi:PAS domain S-box-containing protein